MKDIPLKDRIIFALDVPALADNLTLLLYTTREG